MLCWLLFRRDSLSTSVCELNEDMALLGAALGNGCSQAQHRLTEAAQPRALPRHCPGTDRSTE